MNKERGEEIPTIIEQLNDEMRKASTNPYEYPTVEGLAARMHIDMFTLTHWLETDGRFKEGLETVKRAFDNDPWRDEADEETKLDTAVLSFGIVLVLEETKKRYTV